MKILAALLLIILTGLGVWYMANPELWNNKEYLRDRIEKIEGIESVEEFFTEALFSGNTYSCTTPARKVSKTDTLKHYTWTDEDGGVHFSSEDPGLADVETFDSSLRSELNYFNLNIEFKGGSSVSYLENRLSAQLKSMYKILAGLLDEDNLKQVDLNLVIYPDRTSYLKYATKSGGANMATSGGFYSSAKNEAVTYQYANDENTFATARHEGLHVILQGILGNSPNWLNEGLAEYFERMTMKSQYQLVDLDYGWLQKSAQSLNNGYPAKLSDYLLLQDKEWRANNNNDNVHYALGWSFVYFLLSTPEGKNSLSTIMNTSAEYPCDFIDTPALFDQSYPNGFSQLQTDFVKWFNDPEVSSPHRY